MGVRLFVGNLPYDATENEIRNHFSPVGILSYVSIPLDRETGKKRGFAFVEFADAEQAQAAWKEITGRLEASGQKPVVDHVFAFEDVKKAFARLAEGPMGKVLVKVIS